jgi:hypothetical protein
VPALHLPRPDRVVASGTNPDRTRPLCPYPWWQSIKERGTQTRQKVSSAESEVGKSTTMLGSLG